MPPKFVPRVIASELTKALEDQRRRDTNGRCIGCGRYVKACANVCTDCDPRTHEDY